MNRSEQLSDAPLAIDPYSVLHLRPTAPHELVIEVYWHLTYELRAEAKSDPSAGSRLAQLNEAYATLVGRGQTATDADDEPSTVVTAERGHADPRSKTSRRGGAETQPPEPKLSPWDVLHVDPGAPPSVVDLAYDFWRVRLRGQEADSPERAVAQLREAHRAIRDGTADEPPEPPERAPSVPGASATTEAGDQPSAARRGEDEGSSAAEPGRDRLQSYTQLVWRLVCIAAVWTGRQALVLARAAWKGLRAYAPRVWGLVGIAAVWAGRQALALARSSWKGLRAYAPRVWRLVCRLTASGARWVFGAGRTGSERVLDHSRGSASRSSAEHTSASQELPMVIPDPSLEERFAALAAMRGAAPRRQPADRPAATGEGRVVEF